uniref:Uncharacterized protein n=1 Tax=Pipistrellus kuhlii TaxID=59472 RepID=A0A7J8A8B5_PIPKU|nr:hypothetical protein mPipKuh1_008863 [Pipistrellus kuhlii]
MHILQTCGWQTAGCQPHAALGPLECGSSTKYHGLGESILKKFKFKNFGSQKKFQSLYCLMSWPTLRASVERGSQETVSQNPFGFWGPLIVFPHSMWTLVGDLKTEAPFPKRKAEYCILESISKI